MRRTLCSGDSHNFSCESLDYETAVICRWIVSLPRPAEAFASRGPADPSPLEWRRGFAERNQVDRLSRSTERIKGTIRGLGMEDENSTEVNPEFSTNVFDTLSRAVTWARLARDPARTDRDCQNNTDVEPLPLKPGSPVGTSPDHVEKGRHVYADRFDIAHR